MVRRTSYCYFSAIRLSIAGVAICYIMETHDLGLQGTEERPTSYFQILGIRCRKAMTPSAKRETHPVRGSRHAVGEMADYQNGVIPVFWDVVRSVDDVLLLS